MSNSRNRSDEPALKKLKGIELSNNDYLKNRVKIGDKTTTVVAYVDEIFGKSEFKKREDDSEFTVFKFLLSNHEGSKIQCSIFNDDIRKFVKSIKMNKKLILEKVHVQKVKKHFNRGNLDYEIVLRNYSTIFCCGEYDVGMYNEINFDDIPSKRGPIKIEGYLKDQFVQKNKNNENEILGVITNGRHKLDIIVVKDENEKIESYDRGVKLEVCGDLQENGSTYMVKVKGVDKLRFLGGEKMEIEKLILGNEVHVVEESPVNKDIDY